MKRLITYTSEMVLSQGIHLVIVALTVAYVSQTVCTSCPHNSYSYEDKCYLFVEQRREFHVAETDCLKNFGKLVSVTSRSLRNFLSSKKSDDNSFSWVGLKEDAKGELRWTDGTPMNQYFVIPDRPKPSKCYAMNYTIQPEDCSKKHWYICERNKELYDPIDKCRIGVTEHSFISSKTGNCIYRLPITMKENEKEDKCEDTGGQYLDVLLRKDVESLNEYKFILNDGYKYWTDFDITQDLPPRSDLGSHRESCKTFSLRVGAEPRLYKTDCDDQAYVFCMSTVPMIPQEQSCPKGLNWTVYRPSGRCFWATSIETNLSWTNARYYCQAYGGDLASFHSADEEKTILSLHVGRWKPIELYELGPGTTQHKKRTTSLRFHRCSHQALGLQPMSDC